MNDTYISDVRNCSKKHYSSLDCGSRIKRIRKGCGMTQEKFAEKLDISIDHLAKVELGKRSCSLEVIAHIANELNVSLDYLVFGADSPKMPIKKILLTIIDTLTELVENL